MRAAFQATREMISQKPPTEDSANTSRRTAPLGSSPAMVRLPRRADVSVSVLTRAARSQATAFYSAAGYGVGSRARRRTLYSPADHAMVNI